MLSYFVQPAGGVQCTFVDGTPEFYDVTEDCTFAGMTVSNQLQIKGTRPGHPQLNRQGSKASWLGSRINRHFRVISPGQLTLINLELANAWSGFNPCYCECGSNIICGKGNGHCTCTESTWGGALRLESGSIAVLVDITFTGNSGSFGNDAFIKSGATVYALNIAYSGGYQMTPMTPGTGAMGTLGVGPMQSCDAKANSMCVAADYSGGCEENLGNPIQNVWESLTCLKVVCTVTNGTTINSGTECSCGTATCTNSTGMYCAASRDKCYLGALPGPPKKVNLRVAGENSLSVKIVPENNNIVADLTHFKVALSYRAGLKLGGHMFQKGIFQHLYKHKSPRIFIGFSKVS
jgi:hypothetical protein